MADRLEAEVAGDPRLAVASGEHAPEALAIVRLYAFLVDGTVLSLRYADADPSDPTAAARLEMSVLAQAPISPSFLSHAFYFPPGFQFADPAAESFYTGPYLDMGNLGVVTSLMQTFRLPVAGDGGGHVHGVLAVDVQLPRTIWSDLERAWGEFFDATAHGVDVGRFKRREKGPENFWWSVHHELQDKQADPALREAVHAALLQVDRDRPGEVKHGSVVYQESIPGGGILFALQEDMDRYVVVYQTRSKRGLLSALGLILLGLVGLGFASRYQGQWARARESLAVSTRARREAQLAHERAEEEQRRAVRALRQNLELISTMGVPLVVLDAHGDRVLSCNPAARRYGIREDRNFGADYVSGRPEVQEHYGRMQRLGDRRAYGVYLNLQLEGEPEPRERFALIRSVRVREEIPAPVVPEESRYAIIVVEEPGAADPGETDFPLLRDRVHRDARKALSLLTGHCLQPFARALVAQLESSEPDAELARWLAAYLRERIGTVGWIVGNWRQTPPDSARSPVRRGDLEALVERLGRLFESVRADAELRDDLGWDNRLLSGPSNGPAVQVSALRWEDDDSLREPRAGLFDFFLGEVLINAVKHGAPGGTIDLSVDTDRARRDLRFLVTSPLHPDDLERDLPAYAELLKTGGNGAPPGPRPGGDSYRGLDLLLQVGHLCAWPELAYGRRGDRWVVRWAVPMA